MFLLNIWKLSETQSYIVIGLAVVAVLCLIGIIVLSVKDKKNDKAKKDDSKEALESANNDIEKIEDKESSSEILNKDDDKEIVEPTNDSAQASTLEEEADSNAASEEKTVSEDSVDNKQEEKFIDDSLVDPDSKQEESIIADENKNIAKTVVKKDTFIKVNYLKSFRAKLSMSNDETREFYRIIKSHCLKYGLKSRMSWACETIYKGRVAYAKLTIRGKNLNVNLALNPADFENTKYYFKDTSDSKKYAMVPMRVKVKSSRSTKYVLELIDIMMEKEGIETNDKYDDSVIPEEKRSLEENLELGLIKKVENIIEGDEYIKAIEDLDDEEDDDDEDDEIENDGESESQESDMPLVLVNYIKSFRAKLSMANLEAREYYEIVKNYLLSYKLKSRMSWACETIYKGRVAYAKLTIRGKNLNVNLALNPADFENTKYYFKDTSDSKKYAMVPMRVKVKSSRGLKYVLELIDIMMNNNGLKKIPTYENVNTAEQVRSFDENLSLGLIKKINGRKASLEEIEEERIINDIPDTSVDSASENGDSDELVIDDEIMEMVTEIISTHKRVGKKGIINLDDIDRNFEENELVSVKSLKEKKLISSNIGQVKCLSRGKLTKPLIFELDDYSLPAIKTILVTGGEIR